jgi:hypothetical protein
VTSIFPKPTKLFAGVPGPAPWYLRSDAPELHGFTWVAAGDAQSLKTLLVGPKGPVAILDAYTYTLALDRASLLVWFQRHPRSGPASQLPWPTPPVSLFILHPNELVPLKADPAECCATMQQDALALFVEDRPAAELFLSTVNASDELHADFPAELKSRDELLILCQSSGIEIPPESGACDLALLVARPKGRTYRLYPQDWFNTGGLDYGYQWVTRVVRNPRTGLVHGEGFRIDPFVLDDSLRGLRWS